MQNSRVTLAAAALLAAASPATAAGTWVPANVPSGGSNFALFDINDNNIVTGVYNNASGNPVGVFGPFDGSNYQTINAQPRGLNNRGWIVGFDASTVQPWERAPSGKMKYITGSGKHFQGTADAVSNANVFVGGYTNARGVGVGGTGAKFKWTGKVTCKIENSGCSINAIDAAGDVAGWYYDSSGVQHGFYQPAAGAAVKIDYPDAYDTAVEGLNDKGKASGQWEDASGVIHGFVYDIAKKTYESVDAPGASITQAWGINNNDVIAVSAEAAGGAESFAYCMSTKGCPGAGAVVRGVRRRASGETVPARAK